MFNDAIKAFCFVFSFGAVAIFGQYVLYWMVLKEDKEKEAETKNPNSRNCRG